MDFPFRRKISHLASKNLSTYFNFWCRNNSFAVSTFADRDVVHFVEKSPGSKKTGHFYDGICGQCNFFQNWIEERKLSINGHLKKAQKLSSERKQLELFINIYIFGRGGNHLCIDEYRSTQQNHVCRNGLIWTTTPEVDITSGKGSSCVWLMINEWTLLLRIICVSMN